MSGGSTPTIASVCATIHSMRAGELVQKKVRDVSDFEWLKQCRFYWHDDKDTVIISICDRDFEYSFEYLGVALFVPFTAFRLICNHNIGGVRQFSALRETRHT